MGDISAKGAQTAASLCWQCARSVGGLGCPRIDMPGNASEPIPGWEAKERTLRNTEKLARVYVVKACPLFAADGELEAARQPLERPEHSSVNSMCRTPYTRKHTLKGY